MKICISSSGKDMDAEVDPRFGRAAFFILVDSDTSDFEILENTQNLNLPQGAGIQAGKTVADGGANVLITGNCGPKAFQVLEAAGIQVVSGASGTVKEVLDQYRNGALRPTQGPNVEGHWM